MSDKSLTQEEINNLILLYKKGLIKEALAEAEQLIENNPNSFFLHNIHGMININLKKWNKSIESLSTEIKIFFFFISTKKIELSDFTQSVPSPNKVFDFQTHSGFEVIIFNLY